MATIAPKDRDRYAEHASPDSIAVYLKDAQTALRAQERYVQWLEELLARRTAEKAAGVWPPGRPLEPGERVVIDAPKISPNHGRQGVAESVDELSVIVSLDGDSGGPWLFGPDAVKRVEVTGGSSA